MQLSAQEQAQLNKLVLATKLTGRLPGAATIDARTISTPPESLEEAAWNLKNNSCATLEGWREAHARAYLSSMGIEDPGAIRRIVKYWQRNVTVPFSQLVFDLMCGAER